MLTNDKIGIYTPLVVEKRVQKMDAVVGTVTPFQIRRGVGRGVVEG
jgi:hypothetical protein